MAYKSAYFRAPETKGLLPLDAVQAILAETEAATRDGVVYLTHDPETGTVAHPRKEVDKWKALPAGCVMWEPGRFLTYRLISALKERNSGVLPEGTGLSTIALSHINVPSQKIRTTTDSQVPVILKAFGIEGHPEITKAMRQLMEEKPEKSIPFIRNIWKNKAYETLPTNLPGAPAPPDRAEARPMFADAVRNGNATAAPEPFTASTRPVPVRSAPPAVPLAWARLFARRDELNGEIDWFRKAIEHGGPEDQIANTFKACRSPQHFPTQLEGFLAEMDVHAREFLATDSGHERFCGLHKSLSELYTQATALPEVKSRRALDDWYVVPGLGVKR